jgi:hypothetical protein
MVQSTQSVPAVLVGLLGVAKALAAEGIGKDQNNKAQGFKFRGVDDVMGALSPLLVANNLLLLPEALELVSSTYPGKEGKTQFRAVVKLKLTIVSAVDGSRETVTMYGEGADSADKSTGKANSYAFKDAMLKAFCVPIQGNPEDRDPDFNTPESGRVPAARAQAEAPAKLENKSADPETLAGALERLASDKDKRKKLESKILQAYGVMLLEEVPADRVQEAIQAAEKFVAAQNKRAAGKK